MKKKPYKDWVSLYQIVKDGWSRGFKPEQTVDEAGIMGYSITLEEVNELWEGFKKEYEEKML